MTDKNLTLKALAERVFFETQEIEDVLDMLRETVSSIFNQKENAKEVKLSLGNLSRDSANGTIMIKKDNGQFGLTGFMIRKEKDGLINGHPMADMLSPFNLNSRDGLMEFAVRLYEDAAQNLASNEAAKKFELRSRKP